MRANRIRSMFAVATACGAIATACSNAKLVSPDPAEPVCPSDDPACARDDAGQVDDTGGIDAAVSGLEFDASLDTTTTAPDTETVDTTTVVTEPADTGASIDSAPAVVDSSKPVVCVPGSTQCTDCIDNDGDGLVDWMDPECTSPLDRDEGSFATGIPGDNLDACKQDCWFDGNSGAGDDGCVLDGRCLVGSTDKSCPYGGDAWASDPANCPKPSAKCIEYCGKLTPKGCDCAGCCEVYDTSGVSHLVKLTSTCTYETLGDPSKCPTCAQIPECSNPCGKCEWCLGKTSLPAECYPPPPDAGMPPETAPPPPPTCSNGAPVCSPTQPCPLPDEQYCLTGCCVNRVF